MFLEQREDPRHAVELPLKLGDGSEAVARNISASGMYIEIRGDRPANGTIFVELDVPDTGMRLSASGHIVRLEHREGVTGIAVRLESPQLRPV